ncbi:MAG: nucleotidyltransferase family protein [Candidatus Coproplasma sp.]
MKICAIICEFNPFHNGHAKIIDRARELSHCDAVVCVMSGQFTQRGDMCRTDKYLRAKHAILAGADAVIELPAPFAVAPAEIFAKGAIKLISRFRGELSLCFGSESGTSADFIDAAKIMLDESEEFKERLAKELDGGQSYIKSYASAFAACGGDVSIISSPNNVLGVEYCKAVLCTDAPIEIFTAKRECGKSFAPAHTIRRLSEDGDSYGDFMPEYSFGDFISSPDCTKRFEQACTDAIFMNDKEDIKRIYGCNEGLENRLKRLVKECGGDYKKTVEEATSKRYSSARIKRIMTANLLRLYADDTEKFLNAELSLKVLAIKDGVKNELLPLLSYSPESESSVKCYEINSSAYSLWRYLSSPTNYKNENEKTIFI